MDKELAKIVNYTNDKLKGLLTFLEEISSLPSFIKEGLEIDYPFFISKILRGLTLIHKDPWKGIELIYSVGPGLVDVTYAEFFQKLFECYKNNCLGYDVPWFEYASLVYRIRLPAKERNIITINIILFLFLKNTDIFSLATKKSLPLKRLLGKSLLM